MRSLLLATLAALLLASCSTVDSGDLKTSGMKATMVVVAHRDGADVHVNLSAGGNTSVELRGEDSLSATFKGDSDELGPSSFLGLHTYSGQVPASAPGDKVTVTLSRADGDTAAPSSTVAMPEEIAVLAPVDGARVRRSRDLMVRVNDAPGSIRVSWMGSCVVEGSGLTFGDGSPVIVPAKSIVHVKGAPRSCAVTLTTSRIIQGTLDEAFKGGTIRSERPMTLAVRSVP